MKGEDHPLAASHAYDKEIAGAVERGVGLLILGVGADAHIAALFPHSPALRKPEGLCMPVDRPDGFKGLTLTPEALLSARSVIFIVSGDGKSEAVERALTSTHDSFDCPVRLFAEHPDATFLLDAQAASRLTLE